RDVVETGNLHRQMLYSEADAAVCRPKAVAAAEHLAEANSTIRISAEVTDLQAPVIDRLLAQADIILDATDNYETRFLINDWAVSCKRPWIYGGVLATGGMSATIIPGTTACLACIQSEAPPPGSTPTCDTAGILPPVVQAIAAIQVMEVLKLVAHKKEPAPGGVLFMDLWTGESTRIPTVRNPDCPCCVREEHLWLSGKNVSRASRMCGRNAVHIAPPEDAPPPDLAGLAARLCGQGRVTHDDWSLHFANDRVDLIAFRDGRILVRGTQDSAEARTIVARWLGM
ncbi:MAG TPA: ThiF family adenylyltransferase, partial [Spirochaetota bacterium]|nr:ThiF family adenylyltransferase [Spirochaetota bacterium]